MNAITITTPQITLQADDTLTTTSTAVAEFFGRSHKNVMQAISNLKCSAEFTSANFSAHVKTVAMPKGATRQDTYYVMTEQGFTILAMGFTGEKAMKFKEAYITRFHTMQTELLNTYKQDALPNTISPKQKLAIRDAMNKKVYDNYGKKMIATGFKKEWHAFYEMFEISKYEELPTNRFDDAMVYLLGEWTPESETQQAAIPEDMVLVSRTNLNALIQLNEKAAEAYDSRVKALETVVTDASIKMVEFRSSTWDAVRDGAWIAKNIQKELS
ncbi:MAG: Rha family transcriptional regulator [Mariprofundaceae bacterium]|nr:Rha family transcriptional regulator [Mariprofundaceae bacterium]